MIIFVFLFICGTIWGSFLNMCAWRLISGDTFFQKRSICPTCRHPIAWYDMIPVLSWLSLKGSCRRCHTSISWIYPCIEMLCGVCAVVAYIQLATDDFIWYSVYASSLLITIHTDMRMHAISPWVTIYLIPLSIIASYFHILPISWYESIICAASAYLLLAGLNAYMTYRKGKQAIGQGDWELLAYIASVSGIYATAMIMLLGSITTIGMILLPAYWNYANHITDTPLPLGAGLALAALVYPLL